ncbi:MAG: hypothetical protein AAFN27_01800 [Pseudomonadota bacterium]
MLEPGIMTVVAPIACGKVDALEGLLRDKIDQKWHGPEDCARHPKEICEHPTTCRCVDAHPSQVGPRDETQKAVCTCEGSARDQDFKFAQLPSLHCCAFVIARAETVTCFRTGEEKPLPALLIMEATFDGPIEDFVGDLLTTNFTSLCKIFSNCAGFPRNPFENPGLVADFLVRKHIPHDAYFSGVPGRSISEIKSEAELRDRLSAHLHSRYGNPEVEGGPTSQASCGASDDADDPDEDLRNRPAARFRDLQRELRNVVRRDPRLNLTEERPSFPASVTYGWLIWRSLFALVGVIFLAIGWGLLSLAGAGLPVIAQSVSGLLDNDVDKLFWAWAFLVVTWYWLRRLRTWLAPATWPRFERGAYYLKEEFARLVLAVWRWAILITGGAFAFHYLERADGTPPFGWSSEIAFWAVVTLLVMGAFYGLRILRAPVLRRLEIGPFVTREAALKRARDRECLDHLNMAGRAGWLVLYLPFIAVVETVLPLTGHGGLAAVGFCLLGWLAALAILAASAMALALAVKDAILIIAHGLQKREDNTYARAAELARRNISNSKAQAREEHHTHRNQNHFASVTLVKSGTRRLYLRVILWLVNFVARYFDNKGKLGGIPTIFSARWLLLDDGHRLVFLTNYVGAWDSYLGEFSDLNAYIGVNAIWTNTYLPLTACEQRLLETKHDGVGFPRSKLLLFCGAAYEQPFKAYVRKSQIETLAWYGAYTDLSVPNINDNTRIRRDLFRTLRTDELEDLFSRI